MVFLRSLSRAVSSAKRSKLLTSATREELLTLVEIAFNILKGNFPLSNAQKKKMFPHAQPIRRLAAARTPRTALRIAKSGDADFFRALLKPIILHENGLLKKACQSV